jgi:hypothetical protein
MKPFARLLACAGVAALAGHGASAAPITVDFDFSGQGPLQDSYEFASGPLTLTASAGRFNSNNVLREGRGEQVRQYARGLGITSGPTDDFTAIDGTDVNEVLKLSLDAEATISSITFAAAGSKDEFQFFFDGNGDGVLESDGARLDIDDDGSGVGVFLFAETWTGDSFGIGARYRRDRFFVKGASFTYDDGTPLAVTPVPAALPLFTTALVAVGFAGWRRRKA